MRSFVRSFLIAILLQALFVSPSFAGTISAEVDKTNTSIDEPLWLTVIVSGSLEGDLVLPDSKDFQLQRTGESTNISIVNGSIHKERQFTYQVQPTRSGRLTIPPLSAKVDGKMIGTLPISVDVSGEARVEPKGSGSSSKKLVFVERELPKTSFYEGETIISVVRLLMRARLSGATPLREPAPDWRLIPIDGQKNVDIMRDGQRWSAIEMREGLIALRPGKLKAPSFGITATWVEPVETRQPRRPGSVFDLFQQGIFDGGQEVTRKLFSDPVDILVKPLPNPRPQNFADIVGAFRVSGSVSSRELNQGDTATVTIEIKGQGALDRMQEVKLNILGAKIYADKPILSEKIEPAAGLVSSRTMKYAVVANKAGPIDLGEVMFSSFNPFTEQYEELKVNLGKIVVTSLEAKNSEASPPQTASVSPTNSPVTEEKPIDEHSAPMTNTIDGKLITETKNTERSWWFAPWVLAVEILLLAIFIGFLVVRYSLPKSNSETSSVLDKPQVDWSNVRNAFLNNRPEALHLLFDALKLRCARPGQDPKTLTTEDIFTNASYLQLAEDQLSILKGVLSRIDQAEYGTVEANPFSETLRAEIFRLIDMLEVNSIK